MNYTQYSPRKDYEERLREKLGDKGTVLGFYKDERGYCYSLVRFHECGH